MIKKYTKIIGTIVLAVLCISIYYLYENNKSLRDKLDVSISNEKAFLAENSLLKEDNRVFKFTVEQLNYYNDSINQKLNEVRKELNIKDKDLKNLQYLLSELNKKDTIRFKDTIFIDKTVNIDTLLGDNWYSIYLGLRYPNSIIVNPKFTSEKYIITSIKKETINPPKKCWLLRIFQKKHKVLRVEVIEKNPYINNKQQRFIEIIE